MTGNSTKCLNICKQLTHSILGNSDKVLVLSPTCVVEFCNPGTKVSFQKYLIPFSIYFVITRSFHLVNHGKSCNSMTQKTNVSN